MLQGESKLSVLIETANSWQKVRGRARDTCRARFEGNAARRKHQILVQLLGSSLASRALRVPRVRVYFARARAFESARSLVLMERPLE